MKRLFGEGKVDSLLFRFTHAGRVRGAREPASQVQRGQLGRLVQMHMDEWPLVLALVDWEVSGLIVTSYAEGPPAQLLNATQFLNKTCDKRDHFGHSC